MAHLPSGTVTFLFTDIEGSTRLWEQHPRAMQLALAQHHALLREAIEARGGVVFQIIGDAFCAAFATAPAALLAALAAQRALHHAAWDTPAPLRVRMALHTAAIELHDGEYPSGQHFNRIARILHLGHGGQLLLSLATEQLVRDHLPPDTALRDLGQGGLRGLTRAEHVFQLVAPDLQADFPPLKDFDTRYLEAAYGEAGRLPNPYKGLRAFHEADAADFFGREALTERLLARLAEDVPFARFLALVGPSGSGKSSVVRAGLVPALRQGRLPGSDRWLVVDLLPGAYPLEELEAVLLSIAHNPPETLLTQLREDERGLIRAVKRVLPRDETVELVLVLDQFEEVFTLVEDEATRVQLLTSLHAAVTEPRSRLRVLVTLRADFYDRPLLYPDPGELLRERTEVILPLTAEELERAIERPAARMGVTLEPELIAAIVADVGEQVGALPLLQYALTELFERREGRMLTLEAYRASGGVLGALSRRAEALYSGLSAVEQGTARQLFLRLVTLGEGVEDTRRRVRRSELAAIGGATQAMEAVIETYGRYRLLTFDHDLITGGPTVEVAHEALIRTWARLREWLDTSRTQVRLERQLLAAAAEWASAGQDPSFLATGVRLAQFEGLATQGEVALTAEETTYLQASIVEGERQERAEHERQARELALQRRAANRLRFLIGVLALFLIVATGLSTFAFQQRGAADQQRQAAEANAAEANRQQLAAEANLAHAEAQRLAADANRLVAQQGNVDVATVLAIRSVRTEYTPQGAEAVDSVLQLPYPERVLTGDTGGGQIDRGFRRVRFSPDGRYLLSGDVDGTVRLWDVQTGKQLRQFPDLSDGVLEVNFSPDGTLIAAAGRGGAYVASLEGDAQPVQLPAGYDVWGMVFSPDGRHVMTAGEKTVLWDVRTGQEIRHFAVPAGTLGLAVSPDWRTFATGDGIGSTNTIRLWDAQTGELVRTLTGHTGWLRQLAFSPDGTRLLSASLDSTARLWDVATGAELLRITGHTGWVHTVAFAPDGRTFVTGSLDRTIRLWDTATGKELRRLNAHTDEVYHVAFSPDGRLAASASLDRTIRLWRITGSPGLPRFMGHTGPIKAAAFTPDGKTLVTGSEDATVRVWNVATGEEQKVLDSPGSLVHSIALSPDGQLLVSVGPDLTVQLWDMPTGKLVATLETAGANVVWGVAISPDGRYLATIGWNDVGAEVWDLQTREQIALFRQDDGWSVAFSPDSRLLLTGGRDGYARVWDIEKHDLIRAFQVDGAEAMSVAFAPDGQAVVTGSIAGAVQLWDLATRKELRRFVGHNAAVRSVMFSRDGKYVLTASEDQTARLWDVQTGAELRRFVGHSGAVLSASFSPDGRYVLTTSSDRTARLWYTSLDEAVGALCGRLLRDFTNEERAQHGIPNDGPTCPAR